MLKSDQSPVSTNHIVGVHTSEVLRALIDEAPRDEFTLRWLIGSLPHRSFGAILVFLGVIAMVPVVSIPAGLLITVLAVQIVLGYRTPILPRALMNRPLPSSYLRSLEQHAIPFLTRLETAVRPRWPTFVHGMLRITGGVILLLTVILLTFPLPLSNIPPAAIITLIALADTEQDGLVLSIALVAALLLLVLAFAAVLGLVDGAEWLLNYI
jgi:hypothetical protein